MPTRNHISRERQGLIADFIRRNGPSTRKQIAEGIGIRLSALNNTLVADGSYAMFRQHGPGREISLRRG